jgi:hypothetical protein
VVPSRDQERRSRLEGVVEHAHGVAEPRRHVDVDGAQPPLAWA